MFQKLCCELWYIFNLTLHFQEIYHNFFLFLSTYNSQLFYVHFIFFRWKKILGKIKNKNIFRNCCFFYLIYNIFWESFWYNFMVKNIPVKYPRQNILKPKYSITKYPNN